MKMKRTRGPYKQYLVDETIPIPETTLRRLAAQNNTADSQQEEPTVPREQNNPKRARLEEHENPLGTVSDDSEMECDATPERRESGNNASFNSAAEEDCNDSDSDVDTDVHSDIDSENDSGRNTQSSDAGNMSDEDDVLGREDSFEQVLGGVDNVVPEMETERKPLYKGCDLTAEESQVLIMAFAYRFGLPDIALDALIDLVDCHLPRQEHISRYLLQKKFPEPPTKPITHYYCSECQGSVVFEDNSETADCPDCNVKCEQDELKIRQCYFLEIPLRDQLVHLLQDEHVHSLIDRAKERAGELSDVHSGRVYKKLLRDNMVTERDLTIQFNTDGVRVFKSAKKSLWPIQVAVNNLPYQERKEKILMCGLWLGSKPEMNTYLKPLVTELKSLHTEGLEYTVPGSSAKRKVKVHTIICSVDSQARPCLQKLKIFRGKFGCSFCLHFGEECPVKRGGNRVYRGDCDTLRTYYQHVRDTKLVVETKKPVHGIRGISLLLTLPVFDIIQSFVPDYLHCVLLGVVKSMFETWTLPMYNQKGFHLSEAKIIEMCLIMMQIMPPSEITRAPQSFDMGYKASEWKHFLLYYSIMCLKMVGFPQKYLEHWMLLVNSMQIFLKEKISAEEFSLATEYIRQFVLTLEEIYEAPELMRFNMHLLLHIPKSVKDFGALWAVSCFPFEHYNGVLGKMFCSSQAVPKQICKFYLRLLSVQDKGKEVFTQPHASPIAKKLYESFIFKKIISSQCTAYGDSIRLLGRPSTVPLTLNQRLVIEDFLRERIVQFAVSSYHRVVYKGILIHTESYGQLKRRKNNVLKLNDGRVIEVSNAMLVTTQDTDRKKLVLLGKIFRKLDIVLCSHSDSTASTENFCWVMEHGTECVAIYVHDIERKCILMPYVEEKVCVSPLTNSIERD